MQDQEQQGVGRFFTKSFWSSGSWRLHFASSTPWEWLGHLFFITFILWCALYYQERLFNNDAAYYTWHMTAKEYPFVLHNRYINIFTQGLPLIAMKMGASLKTTLILYSSVFGLIYYAFFLISTYRWKNLKAGIFFALALVLTMRIKHYAGHTEITIAMAHAALLWAWITSPLNNGGNQSRWYYPILVLILAFMYGIHPIIVVPLLMMLGFRMIYEGRWTDRPSWITIGLVALTFGLKFLEVSFNDYEAEKVGFLSNALEVFTKPEDYFVWNVVQRSFDRELHIATAFFFLGWGWLLYRKKWLTSVYHLLCSAILLSMVIVIHSYLKGYLYIMIDGYMGMLGLIWTLPLFYAYDYKKLKPYLFFLSSFLLIFSMVRVINTGEFFTRRLDYYKKTIYMYPDNRKIVVPGDLHDWDKLYYPYETPLEVLMLTSLEGKEHGRTMYIDYDYKGEASFPKDKKDFFLMYSSVKEMNPNFYQIPEEDYKLVDRVSWKEKK